MTSKPININLTKLVSPPNTDFISGRSFGENEAKKNDLLKHIRNNERIIIIIDDNFVKAINDSFIKGFFSQCFKEFKSKDKLEKLITIDSNEYFNRLFKKNWTILEALYGDNSSSST